jgi:hypothetical protein
MRQNIVHLLKNVSTARTPDRHKAEHVLPDLCRGAAGEHFLSIATASPEGNAIAEIGFQFGRIHDAATDLDRIDGVEPGFNHAFQRRPDAAATMETDFHLRNKLLCAFPHPPLAGLKELPVHSRGNLRPTLHPEIVAEYDDIDVGAHGPQEALEIGEVNGNGPIQKFVRTFRIGRANSFSP